MLDAVLSLRDMDQEVIVDLGCGTGLTGAAFKPYAKRLVGIDLSPKMIEVADQVKAINEDPKLDGKQKKEAIKALEGLARKEMEKINEEANEKAEKEFGG